MRKSKSGLMSGAVCLTIILNSPSLAQTEAGAPAESNSANDIIVTAQRVEQRLQDVPISITVFNEQQLANNNVASAKDLAAYTPSLAVSNRYGNDTTFFTIRGFSQELRTTPTVATYFADVVAPRGSGVTPGGDGAGPGQMFDLQNVQVLKGPQGTLFGRNTTGGAVLLVPRKPTGNFEGYIEGSLGDYDLRRVQAVINVPVADSFRVRLGVDRHVRDGYLRNEGLGRQDLGNIDYWALRLSAVADLSDDVENYFIASYTNSKSAGIAAKLGRCFPASSPAAFGFTDPRFGVKACEQIERAQGKNFWTVENSLPTSKSNFEQWQVINTTSWQMGDNLTLKNIFSYAEYRGVTNMDLYGAFFPVGVPRSQVTSPSQVVSFVTITGSTPWGLTNAQSSMVEEIQLQGGSDNGRLNWQAGLYYESNKPLGPSGVQNPVYTPCADISTFNCVPQTPNISAGSMTWTSYRNSFRSLAGYAQASYDITEALKITGGIRYTDDRSESRFEAVSITIPTAGPAFASCANLTAPAFGTQFPLSGMMSTCRQKISTTSAKPTWLLGVDFKPVEDVLLYAKYTRGYRQGSVAPAAPDGLQVYDPEKVNSYEFGLKTNWAGSVPGAFNLAAFYNDFRDQQLQLGLLAIVPGLTSSSATVNVGKSRIYGLEAELTLSPVQGLDLSVAYGYLNTKLQEVTSFVTPPGFIGFGPVAGGELPNAIPHKLTAGGSYTLPLPESLGRVSVGGTFVYQSAHVLGPQLYARLPGYSFGNVNVSWEGVGGLPVDASLFVTNVTNEKMYNGTQDQSSSGAGGYVAYMLAEPRIWGVRLKYHFGN